MHRVYFGRKFIIGLLAAVLLVAVTLPCASAVVEYGFGRVSETLTGRNSAGPYFLAYTNITDKTLEITVNGYMLKAGKDYRVDLVKGVVTFDRVLISTAVAKATYKIIPGKSIKTAGVLKVPLDIELLDDSKNKVRLIGGYTQSVADGQDAGAVIGLGTDNKVGSVNVNTLVLTGKPEDGPAKPGSAPWNDKSLYKVAADTSSGGFAIKGQTLRVGRNFINPGQFGLTHGREADDISMSYKYGKLVDFSAVYQNLNETLADIEHSMNKQNLTVRPGDKTVVAVAHAQSYSKEAGVVNENESTGVRIDQKVGTGAAAISRNEVTTGSGDASQSTVTTELTAHGGNKTVQVSGSAVQKEFSDKDDETNLTLNAAAKPADNVDINLLYGESKNETVGEQSVAGVKVGATTAGNIKIQAQHSETDSTKLGQVSQTQVGVRGEKTGVEAGLTSLKNEEVGEQSIAKVKVDTSAAGNVKIQAQHSESDSTKQGQVSQTQVDVQGQKVGVGAGLANVKNEAVGEQTITNVNVGYKEGNQLQVDAAATQSESTVLGETLEHKVVLSASPSDALQISGYVAGKESEHSIESNKSLSIAARPYSFANVRANYTIKSLNDYDDIVTGGALELSPFAYARFSAGFTSTQSGNTVTTVRDFSTLATPTRFLSVTGKLRQRELQAGRLETHSLTARYALAGSLSIEGNYIFNPENEDGNVQHIQRVGLGLNSNLGRWGIRGGYNQSDEYLLDRMAEERSVNLDYRLDNYSLITAGLLQSRLADGTMNGTDVYSMGYQRKVGSAFEFQLTGRYTKYLLEAGMFNDNVKAEANLAIDF